MGLQPLPLSVAIENTRVLMIRFPLRREVPDIFDRRRNGSPWRVPNGGAPLGNWSAATQPARPENER